MSPQNATNMHRSVSFGTVKVRYFNRIVGDHPGTEHGPPLSIGWEFTESHEYPLHKFEEARLHFRGNSRKIKKQVSNGGKEKAYSTGTRKLRILSASLRRKILLNSGVSVQDIQYAEADGLEVRRLRDLSRQVIATSPVIRKEERKEREIKYKLLPSLKAGLVDIFIGKTLKRQYQFIYPLMSDRVRSIPLVHKTFVSRKA